MDSLGKIYCTEFIVYLVITIILGVSAIYLIKKFVKNEKILYWIIKGTGIALLIVIIINRIATAYQCLVLEKHEDITSWWFLLPESFCGMSCLCFAIVTVFFKPNNVGLHAFMYFAFAGGLCASIYPSYLDFLDFWSLRAFTGLLHHTIMLFLSLLMIMTGYIKPSMKRWVAIPIAYGCFIIWGVFAEQYLGFPIDTMNIKQALIPSQPVLTSWWMLGLLINVCGFVFILLWEHLHNKKSYKEVFLTFKPSSNNE